MFQPYSLLLPLNPLAVCRRIPAFPRRKTENPIVFASANCNAKPNIQSHATNSILFAESSVPSPTTQLARNLGFRASPELGLLSLLLVISTGNDGLDRRSQAAFASVKVCKTIQLTNLSRSLEAVGAFFSLAIISLPAMNAFRRLAISVDKLSKVVSEEVPGTMFSLKLSGLEIKDLTSQLSNLRQRISGNQYKMKGGRMNGKRGNSMIN